MVDILVLGVITAVFGVVFYAMWSVYYAVKAVGGPIIARLVTYGVWFMPAPLAASIIRKKGSAFLGEFLPAFLEAILPTVGGVTNIYYGLGQGLFSELVYLARRYRKYGLIEAGLAGALPAIPAVTLDAILFGDIYPVNEMLLIIIAIAISGFIYGVIAYYISKTIRK